MAAPINIVALGASQTYGKGVSRSEAYPAQLEAMLRAKGYDVRVSNQGINGDTTANMLARLSGAVPAGTTLVILQRGSNDVGPRSQTDKNVKAIKSALETRGIKTIELKPGRYDIRRYTQPDGQHLTPTGYRLLAERFLPEVIAALAGKP